MENKPKKNRIRLIAVIVILLLAIGGGGFFLYGRANPEKMEELMESFRKEEEFTLDLGLFTFNLKEEKTYARLNLAVAYSDEKLTEDLVAKRPAMQDIVVSSLFNIPREELLNLDNLMRNKESLLEKINEELDEDIIAAVYITELKVGR